MKESKKEETSKKELANFFKRFGKAIKEHGEKFIMQNKIKFPINISGVVTHRKKGISLGENKKGSMVMIRPCAEEYKNKTYLGLYLGDLLIEYLHEFEIETKKLHLFPHTNPAIYVFELKKVIWGCESWWEPIRNEEQLKQISDNDIENIWYMKLLRKFSELEK